MFLRPHPPLIAPEPYNAMVHPETSPCRTAPRRRRRKARSTRFLRYKIDGYRRPGPTKSTARSTPATAPDLEIRQMMAAYFGLIAEVDHHLGRIVEHLKATGEYDSTLIIVTSDHAEMLGEHYSGPRRSTSTGVPGTARHPRSPRRRHARRRA